MLDFYAQKQELGRLKGEIQTIVDAINPDALYKESEKLTALQADENFWTDTKKAQEVSQKINAINKKIKKAENIQNMYEDTNAFLLIVEELNEAEEAENVIKEVEKLAKEVEHLSIETLLKGKYDLSSAILTLHAGAGGTEAQDWTEMLYRMYYRFAERNDYKIVVLDRLEGEEAGLKSITFAVEGDYAYGYLKAEMGVHRLVRISPFDSNKRRHTSFASLEVMPEIESDPDIVIKTEDLRVDTYHSGGAGGQHVNKTESAVRLTHLPTGVVVQCQNERSQLQNKEQAMKILTSKLVELRERENIMQAQEMKGDVKKIEWGSQIRSYVFCPYTLVKDHRTNFENTNVNAVMDGDIEDFITEYLKRA